MTVSVLIVDDSGFFRKRLYEILSSVPEIKVVAAASNGREAIELVKKHHPDVITMDYEMPVMDGVTAVRHIMSECPTPILMFSSLTYEGARVTLDALEAGAVDFLPKNFEDIARDFGKMQEELKARILAVAGKSKASNHSASDSGVFESNDNSTHSTTQAAYVNPQSKRSSSSSVRGDYARRAASPPNTARSAGRISGQVSQPEHVPASGLRSRIQERSSPNNDMSGVAAIKRKAAKIAHPVDILLIGASTGGPVAIQTILTKLPANFPVPVIVIQHMPATFTPAFAERLNSLCQINVKHAEDGDSLNPGTVLIAQGAKQLIINGPRAHVRIVESDDRLTYKPSVDITFGSAAKFFPGRVLAVVLTGMGADGREGCRLLKQGGSTVYTQSQKSCVIYGMPMAVDKAGYSDGSIDIDDMSTYIINGVG